ncbi:ABC transporter permease [Rhodopseudomonas sp. HC1]|uniref:cell division protein FtsX n=1 Tax=Rhodopseudomonas infernalis TaxID=2897386 RepID=UPI001EE7B31B|nr:ABC transporter permease [Rhodopseudomonas infernalis]MCG6207651.1 ABC transporter permease [Rhodopseudomonas infernalis]
MNKPPPNRPPRPAADPREVMVDLGDERPQVPARARNASPIVPRASIAGRALVAVVAIMAFLASMTTGVVLLISASAAEWQSEVASELTVQVRPVQGRSLDRDSATVADLVQSQPGIVDVRPFTKEESAKLLEPWLGSGLSLDDLPVPRVIVARIAPGTALDLEDLRRRISQAVPSATIDDHRAWIERMRSMTGATVFAGIGVLALVIIATIISVSFATRGAMAANRPIVEVLHFVGASDRFIADRFFRHFLMLGLQGGLIGGGAAVFVFGFSESVATWFSGTPVGDQFAALLGTFSLRPSGYLALAGQAVLIAAITALASRRTLFNTLNSIE